MAGRERELSWIDLEEFLDLEDLGDLDRRSYYSSEYHADHGLSVVTIEDLLEEL